jgi:intein/homing endonuclease
MGFWGSAGDRVRNLLRFDKEQVVVNLSKGSTNSGSSASTYDVVQDFGQDAISEHLRLDHDLMSRYMDYEDMDEFPELGCLHGDSLIFTMEHGFVKISYLATIKSDFHTIAYDTKANNIVVAIARNARSTAPDGHSKSMVRVVIDNDKEIVCTSDHLFFTRGGEWVQAQYLSPETKLMTTPAVDQVVGGSVVRVEPVNEKPEVFDLEVPGYHNFFCNGVVVHNSALDVYADDATQVESLNNKSVWVDSPDRTVQLILEDLLWKRLRIDEDIWEIARTVVKYGNCVRKGSLVWTSMGLKPIETVEVGDLVQSYRNGVPTLLPVKQRFSNGTKEIFLVKTETHQVYVTAEHLLLVDAGEGKTEWVKACDLDSLSQLGANTSRVIILANDSSGFRSESVLEVGSWGEDEVFDIEIDDEAHNFVVDGVVVHNSFEEILVTGDGVVGTNFLPPPTVRRIEGAQGDLRGFVQDFRGNFNYTPDEFSKLISQRMVPNGVAGGKQAALEDWEVTHFRIRSKNRRSLYGHSVLESARWIHKRLRMLEDSAIVFRLQRAQQRYAFYVDVGDMPPKETLNFIHKVRQQYKKTKFYNSSTGKLDLKFNPLPVSFDTPIPLLDGRTVTIEEMHKEHLEGKKHWVYSIDTDAKQPVPGEVSWVGKTRENAPTIRITFDDNGHADMAPDHPVMRRDGTYVNADQLLVGDSVMPLYRHKSSKENGDKIDGYEILYNPKSKKCDYTHRLVSRALRLYSGKQVVHHRNFKKTDNSPENLEAMDRAEHTSLHAKLNREHLIAYNKSPKKRARTTELNRLNDTAQHIRNYNSSEKHTSDNAIRSVGKTAMWADPSRRAVAQENMHLKFPDAFISGLRELIRANPKIRAEGMVRAVNDGLVALLGSANTRAVPQVHRHLLLKLYRKLGYQDFNDFKKSCLEQPNNHKVIKIEVIEPRDQYCMTVEKWHNFALLLKDNKNQVLTGSGIFTKNSSDEDFFVPVRKGVQGSKIDVVSSPTWQCLTGETRIPLLNGTSPTIKELTETGGEFWLYSIDANGRTVPGRGHSARVTHEAAEIWEVTLDNGEVVRCTGNHPFLTRDGKWQLAQNLRDGDSLMPLYRKESSHKQSDRIDGYEKVYDSASDQWVYTHHRVFEDITGINLKEFFKHNVIHHKNVVKRDNSPSNLEGMDRRGHARLHSEMASSAWNNPARRTNHRKMMVERMADKVIRAEKSKILLDWNRSEERRESMLGNKHPRWLDVDVAGLEYLVLATGARGVKELVNKGRISQSVIERVLKAEGVTWNQFAVKNIPGWKAKGRALCATNHKVVSVCKTNSVETVYDLTVDKHANFALQAGIIVSNSMEDINYFKEKMYAAIKVPKAYLGADAPATKGSLSQQDVRFAHTILRIQRELRNGIKKICRVHLAALGIDPSKVEFEVYMTTPSSIFELAQIEVRNAKADLAGRMSQFVSLHYILNKIFGLSEEEIEYVIKERHQEQLADAEIQSKSMGLTLDVQNSASISQQAASANLQQQQQQQLAAAGPNAQESEDLRKHLQQSATMAHKWPQMRRDLNYRPISNRELMEGNREHEKLVADNLDKILKSNTSLSNRLRELGHLVNELKMGMPGR